MSAATETTAFRGIEVVDPQWGNAKIPTSHASFKGTLAEFVAKFGNDHELEPKNKKRKEVPKKGESKGKSSTKAKGKKEKKAKTEPTVFSFTPFETLREQWREKKTPHLEAFLHLLEHGYAVVEDYVSADIVKKCVQDLDAIEKIWPSDVEMEEDSDEEMESEEESKKAKPVKKPPSLHGLHQWGAYGHLRAQELTRVLLAPLNADFWSCEEKRLLTSSDCAQYGHPRASKPPTEPKKENGQKNGMWMHFDWEAIVDARTVDTVQTFLALTDQSKETGCLVVRKGGHKAAHKFFTEADRFKNNFAARKGAWNLLTQAELDKDLPEDEYPTTYVKAKAGSVVMWLSQTPHQGHLGTGVIRKAFYVCQKPKMLLPTGYVSSLTKAVLPLTDKMQSEWTEKLRKGMQKKREHFNENRMTKHHPALPGLFGTGVRYGNKVVHQQAKLFGEAIEKAGLGLMPLKKTPKGEWARKKNLDYLKPFMTVDQIKLLLRMNGFDFNYIETYGL